MKQETRKYPTPSNIFSVSREKHGTFMQCSKERNVLTDCSDEPMYLFNSSGPLTEMNRKEQAAAAALTM